MTRRVFSLCFMAASILPATTFSQSFLSEYKGLPYHDSRYQGGAQEIPGRVLCAYYDLGGEGVAYHDTDAKNHGSGELNPADGSYLNEFRIHEGVDTSYTKFGRKPDPVDDNPFDKIVPPRELLYVGWTEPGEWFNITVDVTHSGTYAADFLYTSNRGGTIAVDVNGKDATGPLQITSTNDPADPVAWRQWHHWNVASPLFKVPLSKGKNVLTVHILTGGNMNLAYFDFKEDHNGKRGGHPALPQGPLDASNRAYINDLSQAGSVLLWYQQLRTSNSQIAAPTDESDGKHHEKPSPSVLEQVEFHLARTQSLFHLREQEMSRLSPGDNANHKAAS